MSWNPFRFNGWTELLPREAWTTNYPTLLVDASTSEHQETSTLQALEYLKATQIE